MRNSTASVKDEELATVLRTASEMLATEYGRHVRFVPPEGREEADDYFATLERTADRSRRMSRMHCPLCVPRWCMSCTEAYLKSTPTPLIEG